MTMVTAALAVGARLRSAGRPASTDLILVASACTCAGNVEPISSTPVRTELIHGVARAYCCRTCFSCAADAGWPVRFCARYRTVWSRSSSSRAPRVVTLELSWASCSMRWNVSALCTDDTMRVPPSTTAVSVGMVISSSRRDRTRQFFRARREATEPRSAGWLARAARAGAGAGGGGCGGGGGGGGGGGCGGGAGGAAASAAGLVSRSAGGLTVAPPRGALSRDGTASVPLTWLPYYLVTAAKPALGTARADTPRTARCARLPTRRTSRITNLHHGTAK